MKMKLRATAIETGEVNASTATGRLEASMLDTATSNSSTNRLKVPELSLTPIGWIRLNIQARPKNRSSRMKRNRQARIWRASGVSERKRRQERRIMRWIVSTAAVQTPAVSEPVQKLDR